MIVTLSSLHISFNTHRICCKIFPLYHLRSSTSLYPGPPAPYDKTAIFSSSLHLHRRLDSKHCVQGGRIGSMKFGKRLKHQIEESLPEWGNKFLSYKDLKKLVKLICSAPTELPESSKAEAEFVHLLNAEIDKFNAFFMEQEEDFIIRQKELQDRIQKVMTMLGPAGTCPSESDYRGEMQRIRKDIVNLHGEMVLLENYSNVNYTGLAKILKKYDKRTGRLLRSPFIKKVLEQPFFTTDLISQLVKECENIMEMAFPLVDNTGEIPVKQGKAAILAMTDRSIFRNTVAAIETMKEMRKASSTRSPLSLPPLNLPENDLIHSVQIHSPVSIV